MRPRRKYALSLVLLVVLMAGLGWRLSRHEPPDDYGRLMKKQIARNDDIRRQPPPVIATPVTEQTSADPLLVMPAHEQEFLSATPAPAPPPNRSTVNVVGDSSGITIVRSAEARKRPVLAGGIFRQQ